MPIKRFRAGALLILSLGGLAGCDVISFLASSPDPAMSKEAIATREAPPENLFDGELAGERMLLLLHDCEVYRVERGAKGAVHWQSVLAPDFYPIWTACQREGMWFKGGALTVTLGRMAFGAGGCCATGGTWRSVDGRTWKKISESTVPRDPPEQK
ncbi:MAG: hypothetical protein EOO29_06495 [Comamonadaceae bacterium]|nr:MAG: hypothetical protein EOO29_06495 [Comamonadaceae bacterium]